MDSEPSKGEFANYLDVKKVSKATSWLMTGWLPRGHVSVLAGATGIGKSQVAIDITRIVLSGATWPDGSQAPKLDAVMYVDSEGCQSVVFERLERAGVDLKRVILPFDREHVLSDVILNSLPHWSRFEAAVTDSGVQLVIIDSMRGSHQSKEDGSDDMTLLMGKLQRLARDLNITILVIHHLKKRASHLWRVTVDDVRGSGAICANARAVLCIEPIDPMGEVEDCKTLALRVLKSNLAAIPRPLAIKLGAAGVTWVPWPKERTRPPSKHNLAVEFVKKMLADRWMWSLELDKTAEEAAIAPSALKAAKRAAGVLSEKASNGRWYCTLRSDFGPDSKAA